MCSAVHAFGQAAGDDVAGARERAGECARICQPGAAGSARADDRDLRRPQHARFADDEQRHWCAGNVAQQCRKILTRTHQQVVIGRIEPTQVAVDQRRFGRVLPFVLRRGHRGVRAAVAAEQIANAGGPQSGHAQQCQPGAGFIEGEFCRHRRSLATPKTQTARKPRRCLKNRKIPTCDPDRTGDRLYVPDGCRP